MRVAADLFPLLTALKAMHGEIQALRKEIDELRDEVKIHHVQFVVGESTEGDSDSDDSEESTQSVQSAPATVSGI